MLDSHFDTVVSTFSHCGELAFADFTADEKDGLGAWCFHWFQFIVQSHLSFKQWNFVSLFGLLTNTIEESLGTWYSVTSGLARGCHDFHFVRLRHMGGRFQSAFLTFSRLL